MVAARKLAPSYSPLLKKLVAGENKIGMIRLTLERYVIGDFPDR